MLNILISNDEDDFNTNPTRGPRFKPVLNQPFFGYSLPFSEKIEPKAGVYLVP